MSQKPYSSSNLDSIRKRIDALDDRIHDTLMERAELVLKISAEKKKNNIQIVQPAREARMIRRLLDRHKGKLPEAAVVRIWRELVGAVSLLQTGIKVAVTFEEDHAIWDMARDYFGSCLPFQKSASALSAVAAVRDGRANFAVLPWPQDSEPQPWWEYLLEETGGPIRIAIRLPHGDDPKDQNPDCKALVVSKTGFDESGDDRSFLLVVCEEAFSRGGIVDKAAEVGLEVRSLSSRKGGDQFRHLVEVEGFVGEEDARLRKLEEELGAGALVRAVGGYPVPPVYKKTVEPKDSLIPKAAPEKKAAS